MSDKLLLSIAGGAAGAVNGLFSAGGGLVLVPMLGKCKSLSEQERFPASIAIIAPVCWAVLWVGWLQVFGDGAFPQSGYTDS